MYHLLLWPTTLCWENHFSFLQLFNIKLPMEESSRTVMGVPNHERTFVGGVALPSRLLALPAALTAHHPVQSAHTSAPQ